MRLLLRLFVITFFAFPSFARAAVVSMGSGTVMAGNTISVPVTVDVPADVAAAAFTVSYDTSVLHLDSVQSSFFPIFSEQWDLVDPPPASPPPADVTVDDIVYNQPLLHNTLPGKTLLTGVRVQTGSTQPILFNLTFSVDQSAAAAISPISPGPTILNNPDFGYSPDGEEIPSLIGIVAGANPEAAYPALQVSFTDGAITILPDADADSIDDTWEYSYFPGNLTVLSTDNDYDQDGYSDLQEYLNSLAGLDENGLQWNPRDLINAPDQTGYVKPAGGRFWLLMMPAIQAGARQN